MLYASGIFHCDCSFFILSVCQHCQQTCLFRTRGPVEGSEQDLPRQQDAGNWRGGLAKAGQPCRDQQHINDGVSSGRQHLPAQEFPQPGHSCLQSSETHLSCAPKSFVGSSGGGLGQQPFPTEDEGVQSLMLISLCLRQDSFSLLAERCLLPWWDWEGDALPWAFAGGLGSCISYDKGK